MKIEDKEFFAAVGRTDIVDVKTTVIRAKMITTPFFADVPRPLARDSSTP